MAKSVLHSTSSQDSNISPIEGQRADIGLGWIRVWYRFWLLLLFAFYIWTDNSGDDTPDMKRHAPLSHPLYHHSLLYTWCKIQGFCTPDVNKGTRIYHIPCISTLYFTLYYGTPLHFLFGVLLNFSFQTMHIFSLNYDVMIWTFCYRDVTIHLSVEKRPVFLDEKLA